MMTRALRMSIHHMSDSSGAPCYLQRASACRAVAPASSEANSSVGADASVVATGSARASGATLNRAMPQWPAKSTIRRLRQMEKTFDPCRVREAHDRQRGNPPQRPGGA